MERVNLQKELIGAQPIDVLSKILQLNPQIESVNMCKYVYIPLRFREDGNNNFWLSRNAILKKNKIQTMIDSLQSNQQLGIGSKVQLNSCEYAHIPLMDFNIPKNQQNLNKVQERLKHIGFSNGWILETGKSYHYWGNYILTEKEWVDFMGRCLLTSIVHTRQNIEEVADSRYIGHSLRRGFNTLRITTRADKTFVPTVVAFLG